MKRFILFLTTIAIVFGAVSCQLLENKNLSGKDDSQTSESESSSSGTYLPSGSKITVEIHETPIVSSPTDLVTMLKQTRPSVVEIYCSVTDGTSSGSGVIIDLVDSDDDNKDDTAFIVTCHHVIEGASAIDVKTYDGSEYSAQLIGSDPSSDIGIISFRADDGDDLSALTYATWLSNSDALNVGTDVVAIGNPLGTLGGTVTKGIVSAINRDITVEGKEMTLIQTDAAINGGNSGGGLFDASTGALVGIVNAGYASYAAQGLNFAIPANTAKNIAVELMSTYGETLGYIEGKYDFGVKFTLGSSTRAYYVMISDLDEYGGFYGAGLREGDLIVSVKVGNNEEFNAESPNKNTISELQSYLNGKNIAIGDEVTVVYQRYQSSGMWNGGSYQKGTATFRISQYVYGKAA